MLRSTTDARAAAGKLVAANRGTMDALIQGLQTMDAFSNPMARLGFGTDNLGEGAQYPLTRLTRNYILLQSLYRSNWIARKLVDSIAEDMFKNWVQMVLDKTPEELDQFNKVVNNTGTQEKLLTAVKWARLFGGAGAVMMIKGQGAMLDQPLDLDSIDLDSYKGLLVFDRWSGISPTGTVGTDLDRPEEFGMPEYYQCQPEQGRMFKVHASRVLRFTGRSLPQWEWQAEQRWGISEYEVVFDELKKRDNTSWNIASLVFRANIMAMKQKDLSQMLSGIGANAKALTNFQKVLTAQTHLMSNQGLMILPEEGGLETHQYSFGGINDIYVSFMLDICGACEIPMSRLFGRTVTGLGATGEGDEHSYYGMVGQKQNREVNPQLKKLMPVIAMSTWGEVPDDLDWKFNPIREMSSEDQAELAAKKVTAIVEPYNAGIIGRQTAMKELKQISDETGMFSNITDEDIEEADNEPINGEMEEMLGGNSLKALPGKKEKSSGLSKGEGKKAEDADGAGMSITFAGLPVVIENPVGTVRYFPGGMMLMKNHYGYVTGTEGVDGDSVDCFLGPSQEAANVFVVHAQNPETLVYDEDKVMLGFASAQAARAAFLANYSAPEFFGSMDVMTLEDFKTKLATTKGRKITADADPNMTPEEAIRQVRSDPRINDPDKQRCPICGFVSAHSHRNTTVPALVRHIQKSHGGTSDGSKLTKAETNFEHPAKGANHCSQCVHYNKENETCEIVIGSVEPQDWCEEFKLA